MKIRIGDNNKIKNSKIGIYTNSKDNSGKSLMTKHPLFTSTIISFIVGFILLFSFWDKLVHWVENLFLK